MILIDLLNNPPSEEWLQKAEVVTQLLIDTNDRTEKIAIINKNQSLWSELKDHLSKLRNRKCWYTESINDGAHCHVDHFRPKINALDEKGNDEGGYWWLAFEWLNYRYSGPVSNVRKRDYFPVLQNKVNDYGGNINTEEILLLDPIKIGDPSKLSFDGIEGKVIPKSTIKESLEYKQAVYSILRYNLNDEGLKEGRRQKYGKVNNLINRSQKLLKLQTITYDIARQNDIIGIWKELRDLAHPDSEYSATAKYCLKSCGQDWALEIAMAA